MAFNSIQEIIEDYRLGKMVLLVDDEDRENEGDLLLAADCCNAQAISFMAREARGLICLTLTDEHCQRLGLEQMVPSNGSVFSTAFTVSIEAAAGVTTGICAADRARTVAAAVAADAGPSDIVQPGHIFPLASQGRRCADPRRTHRGRLRSGAPGRFHTSVGDRRSDER